ncbi:hypothetical protein GCM10011344_46120 [Dokdonia pacifica]|uniref:Metallo-peptidase family M12B Reprolysin-like n=1 Tax=Dokdonia pacifica TaxID=1627892 RepID=A0A239DBP0_9FLAO|nr:hypothetical protein [Dokdonia pacifica]GGG40034.1 hypothetical protein GCM10011344_46120 [Dokdonia pacifica]SNS29785.1 hypothetical protein SAMN06265376_11090 [Dokdonia pacifica]
MKATFKENILVKLQGNLQVNSEEEGKRNFIEGEMKLQIVEKHDKSVCIKLAKLGWYGLGVASKGKNTGKISGMAHFGKSTIKREKEGLSFTIQTTSDIVYKAIEDELGVNWISDHVTTVESEIFETIVSGKFDVSSDNEGKYQLRDLTITMRYKNGGIRLVDSLYLYQKRPSTFLLAGSTFGDIGNIGNCHPDLEVNERTLTIQPVGYRSSTADTSPTGQSLAVQMASATNIWGKCCINFNVLPIHIITDATLKTSSNITNIRASYASPNANAIEVFFVDNNLPSIGGGVANACNSILGNVVMSDNNAGNPQLLSHELGHILGLGHPGATFTGCTEPDDNTVMTPSNSPNNPNSTNNTHWNCINVANPALSTSTNTCCLMHDIPDTVLKDFPEDTGTESNPGFPGRNFYSMSNVWNRQANAAGGLNADGTPDHENPAKFEMDGVTLHTNYLFAKVDVLENLRVRDAEVRFYLKHPGAGGGAANLQLLGAAPITGTLTPGTTQTVSLPWTVPNGSPTHSCVFAVVHTPAEPSEDITALNWNQTEQLVRDDNDWAQRNLTIESTLMNFGNIAEEQLSFQPIIIDYPDEKGLKTVPLQIEATIAENKAIDAVELVFPSMDKCIMVKPGENLTVEITDSLRPGTKVLMIARAKMNKASVDIGNVQEAVGITPILGDTKIVGYGFSLKTGKNSNAISQLIDRIQGAFADFGEIAGPSNWDCLCKELQEIRRNGCSSSTTLTMLFRDKVDSLKKLQETLLKNAEEAYLFADMDYAYEKLYRTIENQESDAHSFDAIRDLINRFETLNWCLYLSYRETPLLQDEAC